MNASEIIKRLFGKGRDRPAPLPRATVEHDSVDKMMFDDTVDGSPRFKRIAIENAPLVPPNVADPEPIDFTTADPKDIAEWQQAARAAKAAREKAPQYDAWGDLSRDAFYLYHHPTEPEVIDPSEVDPAVAFHAKIARKIQAHPEYTESRNMTRDDATASAFATMALTKELKSALEEELVEQARQSEEFEQAREQAEGEMQNLSDLRDQARNLHNQGLTIPGTLVQDIRDAVAAKNAAQQAAAQIAQQTPVAFDKAAADAVDRAVEKAKEAAKSASGMPGFGQGFGGGEEPQYNSPEQALSIADMWANNELLRQVAALYGKLDKSFQFERAKRIVGGADEIVDIMLGDDIRRILPSELALLADEDFEDEFFMRFLNSELAVFDTVGEEQAGRGPVVICVDESGSMSGERNVWAKAISLCLLNICRREKRDFAYVGWADARQCNVHMFPAKKPLMAQDVVDCASHFFGGGTSPLTGLTAGVKVMESAPEFKKADLVFVTDGDAGWGPEDERMRNWCEQKGVRIWGIGVGRSFGYLKKLSPEGTVDIKDFDLTDPSEATAHLATHIT
jgi:uncharacterized protein with von Willebrand factor type A (vWA) domain